MTLEKMLKMTNVFIQEIINKQQLGLEKAKQECIATFGERSLDSNLKTIYNETIQSYVCPAYWDGILCWSDASPGTQLSQPCPSYVTGFIPEHNATKRCMENGTWFVHDVYKNSWTNYTNCSNGSDITIITDLNSTNFENVSDLIMTYIPSIKLMSMTGYIVSFITLIIAFFIMLSIRKLHCARNILHMHLFASFMLRALIVLIIAVSFEDGLGLPSDMRYLNGSLYYSINSQTNNWECKLMTSLSEYFITANYSWILMEGLYLHNLIFRALFVDSSNSIKWYVIMGWSFPFLIAACWVVVRLFFEDTLCWTTHDNYKIFLIIFVPITVSILINLVLFVRISLVLYKKLRSPINEDSRRYQKWAKSTLVLMPLFGVHYAFYLTFYWWVKSNGVVEVVWLFYDQLFGSFQGFFVAILYCFLNGEVKSELKPYAYYCLTFLATNKCFKYFFPYREKFLRSIVGRNSVCTTMSCSSLYTNGVFHRNSKSRLDSIPKTRQCDKSNNHICHNGRNIQDIPGRNPKSQRNSSATIICETTFCNEHKPCQLDSAKIINEETLKLMVQNI